MCYGTIDTMALVTQSVIVVAMHSQSVQCSWNSGISKIDPACISDGNGGRQFVSLCDGDTGPWR